MSSEPLEVSQPGMEEGTHVSAAPATAVAAMASNPSAVSTGSPAGTSSRAVAPAAMPTVKAVVMHDGHQASAAAPGTVAAPTAAAEEDPEYDPNVVGDFDYPAMRPQECCGCRPPLARCCYKRQMGRAYVCCERRGPNPKIHLMCGSGWTTQIITIVLVFGISFAAYGFALRLLHWAFAIGAGVVAILGCLAISAVGCCDPGVFPRYAKKKEKNWRYCQQSASYRPPGIQWCDETGVLIHDIDHFCPWSGTTIARKNMVWFKLFLAMICVTLVYVVAVVVIGAISQGSTATWPIP